MEEIFKLKILVPVLFYSLLSILIVFLMGRNDATISIDFGVLQINDVEAYDAKKYIYYVCVFLGFSSFFINVKGLLEEYRRVLGVNRWILRYVNAALQEVTGNKRDMVGGVRVSGLVNPKVDTGAWTSYKSAFEKVVVPLPFFLVNSARFCSFFIASLVGAPRALFPFLIATLMLVLVYFGYDPSV